MHSESLYGAHLCVLHVDIGSFVSNCLPLPSQRSRWPVDHRGRSHVLVVTRAGFLSVTCKSISLYDLCYETDVSLVGGGVSTRPARTYLRRGIVAFDLYPSEGRPSALRALSRPREHRSSSLRGFLWVSGSRQLSGLLDRSSGRSGMGSGVVEDGWAGPRSSKGGGVCGKIGDLESLACFARM